MPAENSPGGRQVAWVSCGHARDWRIDGQGQRAQHPAEGVERRHEEPS